jgi:two-component system sensor histidine kinase DctS
MGVDADLACSAASHAAAPMFSRTYFVPLTGGQGVEVIDLCLPLQQAGQPAGFLVGSLALPQVLDAVLQARDARRHEFSLVEGDGTRLARAGVPRGAGIYVAERVVDLPGVSLQLRADAAAGRPSLIPNLVTALVLGLSLALFGVVLLLARDVRRRAVAERALAEALAFRKAMEDSLSTGLRARDLKGRVTYANPAFCAMVGFTQIDAPGRRHAAVLAARVRRRVPAAAQPAHPGPGRAQPARAARRLRDRVHAPERRTLPGDDLRRPAG